jgi:peptidoglycan hydrolase CwlO-like protein
MTQDRNYLRMLKDRELINMGRERDSGDDLVLVLTERLAELADVAALLEAAAVKIEDLEAEIEEITSSREYWRIEATDAQDALEALQAHIDATRGYGPDE